jgi:hypothetical protein
MHSLALRAGMRPVRSPNVKRCRAWIARMGTGLDRNGLLIVDTLSGLRSPLTLRNPPRRLNQPLFALSYYRKKNGLRHTFRLAGAEKKARDRHNRYSFTPAHVKMGESGRFPCGRRLWCARRGDVSAGGIQPWALHTGVPSLAHPAGQGGDEWGRPTIPRLTTGLRLRAARRQTLQDPMLDQSSARGVAGTIGARDLPEEDGLAIADGQEPSPNRSSPRPEWAKRPPRPHSFPPASGHARRAVR